jgi:hypothetical protein
VKEVSGASDGQERSWGFVHKAANKPEEIEDDFETPETAELFNDLRMERSAHPLKPSFEGRW